MNTQQHTESRIRTGEGRTLEEQAKDVACEIAETLRKTNVLILIPRAIPVPYSKGNRLASHVLRQLELMSLDPRSPGAGIDVNGLVYTMAFEQGQPVFYSPIDDNEPRVATVQEIMDSRPELYYITDISFPADTIPVQNIFPDVIIIARSIYPPKNIEPDYPDEHEGSIRYPVGLEGYTEESPY